MKRKLTRFFYAVAVLCLVWGMAACKPDNSGDGAQDGGTDTEIGGPEDEGDGSNAYVETALGLDMKMIYVDSGSFLMGATEEQTQQGNFFYDEVPVHKVHLSPYYMAATEVTQAQWKAVMNTESAYFKGDNLPVEQVSWADAMAFCEKLSEATGKKYTLPTEAQWEFAARGGNLGEGYVYGGSDSLGEVGWYGENIRIKPPHPVGEKNANELGLYDMSGNIWEWCQDWYRDYYSEEDAVNPQGPQQGSHRVTRGGSWGSGDWDCRVSRRSHADPGSRNRDLGFRVVCLP